MFVKCAFSNGIQRTRTQGTIGCYKRGTENQKGIDDPRRYSFKEVPYECSYESFGEAKSSGETI